MHKIILIGYAVLLFLAAVVLWAQSVRADDISILNSDGTTTHCIATDTGNGTTMIICH